MDSKKLVLLKVGDGDKRAILKIVENITNDLKCLKKKTNKTSIERGCILLHKNNTAWARIAVYSISLDNCSLMLNNGKWFEYGSGSLSQCLKQAETASYFI